MAVVLSDFFERHVALDEIAKLRPGEHDGHDARGGQAQEPEGHDHPHVAPLAESRSGHGCRVGRVVEAEGIGGATRGDADRGGGTGRHGLRFPPPTGPPPRAAGGAAPPLAWITCLQYLQRIGLASQSAGMRSTF